MNAGKHPPFTALTGTSDGGLLRKLQSPVEISKAFDPANVEKDDRPDGHGFKALWDTGATASAITQGVVDRLGLEPISMAIVTHADGKTNAEVYLVNVKLPNNVLFPNLRVTKLALAETDMLLGMDVICAGDFAVTNVDSNTVFTYRVPSLQRIDYVEQANALNAATRSKPKVGRNDPCPCGSGRKYKRCCGASTANHK